MRRGALGDAIVGYRRCSSFSILAVPRSVWAVGILPASAWADGSAGQDGTCRCRRSSAPSATSTAPRFSSSRCEQGQDAMQPEAAGWNLEDGAWDQPKARAAGDEGDEEGLVPGIEGYVQEDAPRPAAPVGHLAADGSARTPGVPGGEPLLALAVCPRAGHENVAVVPRFIARAGDHGPRGRVPAIDGQSLVYQAVHPLRRRLREPQLALRVAKRWEARLDHERRHLRISLPPDGSCGVSSTIRRRQQLEARAAGPAGPGPLAATLQSAGGPVPLDGGREDVKSCGFLFAADLGLQEALL